MSSNNLIFFSAKDLRNRLIVLTGVLLIIGLVALYSISDNPLSKENKAFAKIKSIYLTNSLNEDIVFDSKNIGLQDETISSIKSLNLNQIGCMFADKTIIVNGERSKISSRLMKLKIFKDSKKCSIVDLSGDDEVDYSPLFDKIDRAIKVL